MKRTYYCTKEEPLHKQISPKESLLIEEIEVKGYLDGDDYELLTEMSGEKGRLKCINLFGVTESFPGPDYLGCFYIEEEDLAIFPYSFVNSVRLEKIVFPNNLKGIGNESFINCENLVIDELPETVKSIGNNSFLNCPKLKTVFVSNTFKAGFNLGGQFPERELAGSVENYDSDYKKWPLTREGEETYCDYRGREHFVIDSVLFWEQDWCWRLMLERYPAMNRRTIYEVPIETTAAYYEDEVTLGPLEICAYAFCGCKYLKTLILRDCVLESGAICDCPALETIIFKGWAGGTTISSFDMSWSNVITKCPNLKDIYLYAEDPRMVPYELFKDLENIGDIVLHVPCFCAEKYRNHGIEYIKQKPFLNTIPPEPESEDDVLFVKEWRRFKCIEEFDPIDVFGEEK